MPRANYNTHFDSLSMIRDAKGKFYNNEWPTIPQLLKISANKYPNRKCFETFTPEHFVMTYAEVYKAVRQIAHKINSLGFKKGDKIAVSGKNSPEWALCYFGIFFSGCIATPLDALLNETEVENLVKFAEVKMAFIDSDKYGTFLRAGTKNIVLLDKEKTILGVEYIFDWIKNEDMYETNETDISDIAEILFTSGTTGNPKGVMLTHKNVITDLFYAQNYMRFFSNDVFYLILPIHHAYALIASIFVPISAGASIVFGKKIVVNEILRDLKEGKVSVFLGVPALFTKLINGLMNGVKKKGRFAYYLIKSLMKFSGFVRSLFGINPGKKMFGFLTRNIGFENMRICISGAGALPKSTVVPFRQLGVQFVEGYGMTEASPVLSLNPIEGYKLGSVGKIFTEINFKFKNVDKDGNGVLCVKGDMVMKGYYKNPEATSEAIDEDGFLNTGDVGHVDSDNYFYITGRAKNIIVTDGGKNVFPEELEDKFGIYNDIVEQVIIAPYKDSDSKEKIRAIIYPSQKLRDACKNVASKIANSVKEVVAEVNKKLQSYKKISKVQISKKPFEMTTTNKPKRKEIIDRVDKEEKSNEDIVNL